MPDLLGHPARKVDRVILDDSIEANDIRQIFEALNENGQIQSLAPWMDSQSDAQLNRLGHLITRYLYQTAQDSTGLVAILRERVRRNAFSQAREASRALESQPNRAALSHLFRTVVNSPHFLDVVERDIGILSPSLDESLEELHEEFEKAWGPIASHGTTINGIQLASAETVGVVTKLADAPAIQEHWSELAVADMTRFTAIPGLKERWIHLSDSLTDSWPVVGLLQALRLVNTRHGGKAFDGMGSGLTSLIHEPLFKNAQPPQSGKPLTGFDSLMDLVLALEGPSDGLFTAVQEKLLSDPDIAKEMGSLLQPNVPLRLTPYVPFLPRTVSAFLIPALENPTAGGLTRVSWLALTQTAPSADQTKAFFELFKAARTAHENLIGAPRDSDAEDYLTFNLPLYLNSYVLGEWLRKTLQENAVAIQALPEKDFTRALLDLPVSTPESTFAFVAEDPVTHEWVFASNRLQELKDFGLEEFSDALKTRSPAGLGKFKYSIPSVDSVPLRKAIVSAIEAIDEARGYADGSALARAGIAYLTRKQSGGKTLLENLETDNLLLSSHRGLSSLDVGTWRVLKEVLPSGTDDASGSGGHEMLLNLFQSSPPLQDRVSRILNSLGALAKLDSAGTAGVLSPFEAYLEVVRESGPREWRALSEGLGFLAGSGLFAMDLGADGKIYPRFPSAHTWLSTGNASGILRLISEIQPSRYRPLADFVQDLLRLDKGIKGSELHWDFIQEVLRGSPEGMSALLDNLQGNQSLARTDLTPAEREWIVQFVKQGAFREVWQAFAPLASSTESHQWLETLRHYSKDGSLAGVFRLMGLVKNDRIQAIAQLLQEWERSGEWEAFLDTLESLFSRG